MSPGRTVRRSGFTGMTWDFVARLRGATKAKLVLKGIMTEEDSALAVKAGVDGIIVSNHGGRAEESFQSTIGALPAVVRAAGGKIPVLVDGGVRRGTDAGATDMEQITATPVTAGPGFGSG